MTLEEIAARLEKLTQEIVEARADIRTLAHEVRHNDVSRSVVHEHGGAILHLQARVDRIETILPPPVNGSGE